MASYGLTYDAGNRITRSEGTDGAQDYSYDATNQLTAVDHTTQVDEAYSYDANGNRTNGGYGTGTNNRLSTGALLFGLVGADVVATGLGVGKKRSETALQPNRTSADRTTARIMFF